MAQKQMTLSEYGASMGWDDERIIQHGMLIFGSSEEEIRLMLAIERGETDGDIVKDGE